MASWLCSTLAQAFKAGNGVKACSLLFSASKASATVAAGRAFISTLSAPGSAVAGVASRCRLPGGAWPARSSAQGSQPSRRRFQHTDSQGYTHFTPRRGLFSRGPVARYIVAVTSVSGVMFYISSLETIPYTHRRHAIMFVTTEQERMMGKEVFNQQVADAKAQNALLPAYHPYSLLVKGVGLRVAQAALDPKGGGGYHDHMKNIDWEFAVIKSNEANAYVVPGGKVVVFTGLIDILSSEDELAAVLAHETAHVLARHHAERISTLNVFVLLKMLAWAFFGIGLPNSAMVLGVFLPYSRVAEYEADEIGLMLMAKACFDPAACPSMLRKLNAKEAKEMAQPGAINVPAFLRTHPLTEARVQRVTKDLPEAYDLYKQSGCVRTMSLFRERHATA